MFGINSGVECKSLVPVNPFRWGHLLCRGFSLHVGLYGDLLQSRRDAATEEMVSVSSEQRVWGKN